MTLSVHWPSLSAQRRIRDLDSLASERPEILVIGGGITGVGIALDAASRGLSVALVERDDLASGTSGFSSRIVHGGTRYLASAGVGLAMESAVERNYLMKQIAPHLVRTLPMLFPVYADTSRRTRALTRLGLFAGDALRLGSGTGRHALPATRHVSAAEAHALFPGVRVDSLSGGLLTFDAQLEDDARLVTGVARTAAAYGAKILTRVNATSMSGEGAELECTLTGQRLHVEAGAVINATGIVSAELEPSLDLQMRRGTHLLVPTELLGDPRCAIAISVDGDPANVVFAVPQSDSLTLIGTTDVEATPGDAQPSLAEIGFLLEVVNRGLRVQLRREDIAGSYGALRPVLAEDETGDPDLSRRPATVVSPSGAITVVGGKLTTYRRMAQDAVDKALSTRMMWAEQCRSATLPLVGAASPQQLAAMKAPDHLVRRYGAEATRITELIAERPELGERVVPELPTLRAEFEFAITHELALSPDDLVDRRTRLGLTGRRQRALEVATRYTSSHPAR